jgi:hypothetical protein
MRKFWWPEPLYEARPYGALTLGLLAGAVAVSHAAATGDLTLPFAAALASGAAVIVYGGAVLKMRHSYRRRSRWSRERRA